MKKYNVDYMSSTDNDCSHAWTMACSPEEAIENIKAEYWDVEEIIDCYEID